MSRQVTRMETAISFRAAYDLLALRAEATAELQRLGEMVGEFRSAPTLRGCLTNPDEEPLPRRRTRRPRKTRTRRGYRTVAILPQAAPLLRRK